MEDRRTRLLELLRLGGGQTVADLARALRLSRNAVRNLLVGLQAAGLVRPQGLRPSRRRPSVVYGLTPAAEAAFPKTYDAFALALLEALKERNGSTLHEVLERVADRWLDRDRPRFAGREGEERLEAIRDLLAERGFMPVLAQVNGGYEIREHNCPLSRLVAEHPEVCDAVHRWLSGLAGTEVVRVRCMARGDPYSVYRVFLNTTR